MRILYLSPYAPERCGIGDYTASFVRGARQFGHEVGVLSTSELHGAPEEVVMELPRALRGVPSLRARIAAWDPDVVHLEFAVASYGTRLPVLLRLLRELRPLRAQVFATGSLRGPGRALYRSVASHVDRVVVHTEKSRRALTEDVGVRGTPIELVPHPRAELPAPTSSPDELRARFGLGRAPVLLAFGFIHVDKGLDDLVAALRLLPRDDVRLVVAGDVRRRQGVWRVFELRDRLHLRRVRRLIARHGLGERVVFTGYVPAGYQPYVYTSPSTTRPVESTAHAPTTSAAIIALPTATNDPVVRDQVLAVRMKFPATYSSADIRKIFPIVLAAFAPDASKS